MVEELSRIVFIVFCATTVLCGCASGERDLPHSEHVSLVVKVPQTTISLLRATVREAEAKGYGCSRIDVLSADSDLTAILLSNDGSPSTGGEESRPDRSESRVGRGEGRLFVHGWQYIDVLHKAIVFATFSSGEGDVTYLEIRLVGDGVFWRVDFIYASAEDDIE